MGFLSDLFGSFSSASNSREPYPNAIPLTADKRVVAEMFLQNLDLAYQDDPDYRNFNSFMKGPKGIPIMKIWFVKFTKEELLGHNFADWLLTCTKGCFESGSKNSLTDEAITKLCKEVQKLL